MILPETKVPNRTLHSLTLEGVRHIEALHLNRAPLVERRKMRRLMEAMLEREAQWWNREKQLDQEIQKKKRMVRKKGQRRT